MLACNSHEINILQVALKKTPFLPQEGRLLRARRACSQLQVGVFYYLIEHIVDSKEVKK